MCGIAGILHHTQNGPPPDAIRQMTKRLAHRGPDAEGIYTDEHIQLGHRRLSIIDLSPEANQPMWDVHQRYGIVYNGEIYNYKEIREALSGYPFKTVSDSEVILAAYDQWGAKCLDRLNGMFAFAIWDKREKELFIARDRVGKKPLYYAQSDSFFVFGSELRSLLSSGLIERKLDETHLQEYFMYQAPMGRNTLIKGVYQLQAGHFAKVRTGKFKEEKYWGYDSVELRDMDREATKVKVKEVFLDSVRLRMIADVPVAAFLSGGIDSGMVVACMAELSTQPVETFTLGFDEARYDESGFAAQLARQYNTRHHAITVKPTIFLDALDEILQAMDSPSGDGPNTYMVSKYIREAGIKVALSGLGGDELFAGYNKFLIYDRLMRQRWIGQLPLSIRKGLASLNEKFPIARQPKINEILRLPAWDLQNLYPLLRRAYNVNEVLELLHVGKQHDEVIERLISLRPVISRFDTLSQCTVGEMETYTRDVLLRDTDQMAMAHALEVRVPFFDYRLIEFVLSVPDQWKYPHSPKQLLVESLAPRISSEYAGRKKMGFTLPFDHWIKKELRDFSDEKIQFLVHRKEFNAPEVLGKWKNFLAGDPSVLWSRIWKLVVLADWLDRNKL